MILSLKLNEEELKRFKKFANMQNQSLSGMIRKVVEERIQEENDLQTMKEALADYQVDGKVYSLLHVKREFGIQ